MFAGQKNRDLFDAIIKNTHLGSKEDMKDFNEVSPLNGFWHSPKEDETFQTFLLLLAGLVSILLIIQF